MRDFVARLHTAYNIPSSILISMKDSPTDVRQVCKTVDDFSLFGAELRYEGLITYETETGVFKVCKRNADGELYWASLTESNLDSVVKRVEVLEDKIGSVIIELQE